MTRLLLVGAFGQGNPGDEALLDAFLSALAQWDCVATSSDPPATESAHGCKSVPSWEIGSVARLVATSTAVVFAGGTVFKLLHPSSQRAPLDLLRKGLVLAAGARTLAKPVALVGVGASSLEGSLARLIARSLVRRADLLIVRDEESAHLLVAAGAPAPLRVGADASWTLVRSRIESDRARRAPPPGPVLVCLGHVAGGDDLSLFVADALEPLGRRGLTMLLQPWQHHDRSDADLRLAVDVREHLSAYDVEVLPPPPSFEAACDTAACCRLVVAFRFHACVAAAAAGVPFVAFAHEPKLGAVARRLGQPLVRAGATPSDAARTIVAALDHPPADRRLCLEQADLADEGFRLLRLLLTAGRLGDVAQVTAMPLAPHPGIDAP